MAGALCRVLSIVHPSLSEVQARKWLVLLDAAKLVSTCPLDLTKHDADFVAVSFYKIFGLPTGLGALLVKQSVAKTLRKVTSDDCVVERPGRGKCCRFPASIGCSPVPLPRVRLPTTY